jgi:hypothetical protein
MAYGIYRIRLEITLKAAENPSSLIWSPNIELLRETGRSHSGTCTPSFSKYKLF